MFLRNRGRAAVAAALLLAAAILWAGADRQADSVREVELPPMVALTFDDGPRPETTSVLLDGLAARGVHATFFLIGQQIPGNEALVRRMEAEGHQVGIHTYDHVKLSGLNDADFDAQVDGTRRVLREVLGHDGFLLRPPYGFLDEEVKRRAEAPIILWSVDPEDWKYKDAGQVADHILSHAGDGDVILLHDLYPTSVEAALAVVDELRQRGCLFLTVEELAQARGVSLEPGQVYRRF